MQSQYQQQSLSSLGNNNGHSNSASLHSLHSLSPGSSPTAADFPPSHTHTPHSLSRQHSFQHQHVHQDYGQHAHPHPHSHSHLVSNARYESGSSGGGSGGTAGGAGAGGGTGGMNASLPASPGPIDAFSEDAQGRKRQRTATASCTSTGAGGGSGGGGGGGGGGQGGEDGGIVTSVVTVSNKKGSRARSDSAPLGYHQLTSGWPQTRPRSGSGLQPTTAGVGRVSGSGYLGRREDQQQQQQQQHQHMGMPNIASLSRAHSSLPMLSIPNVGKQPSSN